MEDIENLIKSLNDKIDDYQKDFETIQNKIIALQSSSSVDKDLIIDLENKTKDFEAELIDCNKQRREIRNELDKKIVELENSNQSKEEIAKQVIYLTTKTGFTEAREHLVEAWTNYAKTKDNLLEIKRKLNNSRLEAIKGLTKTRDRQWITIWILLGVIVLLSLSLLLLSTKKKKKDIKNMPEMLRNGGECN